MRFMVMIKMQEQTGPPPAALVERMGEEMSRLMAAGVMLDAGGLLPSAMGGARVRLNGGRISVIDGPFTEAKELVGGYSIIEVGSREEALELAEQVIAMHRDLWPGWEGEAEVRQYADAPPASAG